MEGWKPNNETYSGDIFLIRDEDLNNVPDGTVLVSVRGRRFVKTKELSAQEDRAGWSPFGFPDKTTALKFVSEDRLYQTHTDN